MIFSAPLGFFLTVVGWAAYVSYVRPRSSPLRNLPGPSSKKGLGLGGHLGMVLNASSSKQVHEDFVAKYGRNIRIKGIGNFDDRLLTTDPMALSYILNRPNDYQKPWQSRHIISRLIGEGMLSVEGEGHKRMRRVSDPAFSVQNLRALVPIAFRKALELTDKWAFAIDGGDMEAPEEVEGVQPELKKRTARIDVCNWINRAAFDIIGLAGFDYNFSAIQHEENELFLAYRDMFEIVVSRGETLWDIVIVYLPWLERLFPTHKTRTVRKSQEIINRIGGQLIKERTKRLMNGRKNNSGYQATDILCLLLQSNLSSEIKPSRRLSDEEVLASLNTFFFAGSDTTSLTITWMLCLLATHHPVQDHLRNELRAFAETAAPLPGEEEAWRDFWSALDDLPYLNNVVRETLRLISPLHSSIRVATRGDVIPTSEPVKLRDGTLRYGVKINKGEFIHIPIESMNTDKSIWGDDAWKFNPDRWDCLPASVLEQPGLYNHTLSFSAGPRSCIGIRFSLIVIKCFIRVLICNFTFSPVDGERVYASNVVLVRPYVFGKFMEGSQCPLLVTRI